MACSLCGEVCKCSSDVTVAGSATAGAESGETLPISAEKDESWRLEVSARLNRYQAKRKPRPPHYPSLHLRFDEPPPYSSVKKSEAATDAILVSRDALALDGLGQEPELRVSMPARVSEGTSPSETPEPFIAATAPTAKIIEFPRPWTPPARPADELAEPVITAPRILEVPEFVPPLPALGGITIEPAARAEVERRPGVDFPLQSASLARRIAANMLDGVLVGIAEFLFGFIFWKLTAIRPPRVQILEMTIAFGATFWAAYQYFLIVYSGKTPGLWLTRLALSRFDGTAAKRSLRRWRVLASFLSAISLGMGFAWVFLDEDMLCWHDRITRTYLAPNGSALHARHEEG